MSMAGALMKTTAGGKIQRDVFLGFIRIHILHHAAKAPIFGLEMIEELHHHGFVISPGTLYPVLHTMEAAGLLRSHKAIVDGKARRYYRATRSGAALLAKLRKQLLELVGEVVPTTPPKARVIREPRQARSRAPGKEE